MASFLDLDDESFSSFRSAPPSRRLLLDRQSSINSSSGPPERQISNRTRKRKNRTRNKRKFAEGSLEEMVSKQRELIPPAGSLPPEIEEGKIEYKLKLVAPNESRFEHLVTQMKWRLQEGAGEAIYEIGVEDGGMYIGLTPGELKASMKTLEMMADRLGASLTTLREIQVSENRKAIEALIRKVPDDQQFLDIRVAVLGNVECGKSTLVGVISHGELDNGQGRARLNLFRHRHEIQTGRTSSISQEIVGFDSQGEIVNYAENSTAEDICENSSKIIQFIDVPGHQKYLKTTIFGLMGHSPHYAMLVMGANTGIVGTTKEQLGFALCLQVPIFAVVTKTDCCRPATLEKNVKSLEALLQRPGSRKVPRRITSEAEAVNVATSISSGNVVPIFLVSSITGSGLAYLETFLNVLPPTASRQELDRLTQLPTDFHIDEVFTDVPDVGLVVSGTMKSGSVKQGEILQAGPLEDGRYTRVEVTSIHRNRFPCRLVRAGQAAALAIKPTDESTPLSVFRKGMVLKDLLSEPVASYEFEAEINLLFHHKHISPGFQCTLHIGSVCQTATLIRMSKKCLKTSDTATARFKFMCQPEAITTGSKILFRQGVTRGIGTVLECYPYNSPAPEIHSSSSSSDIEVLR